MAVTLTINGQALTAEPGMTVLEAARLHGIYIPTLCYAPKLPVFGGCRMCVVEIEKMPGMPTACTVPVAEGMVVHTETPAVQTQRQETLSLLLSEHPYTCLTCSNKKGCSEFQGTIRKAAVTTGCQYCPKNGQCEIQEVVEHVGLQEVPYPITYRGLPVDHDNPFIDLDMNLCIVCSRCVRACNDLRHAHVLALVDRGDHTVVGTTGGRSLLDAGCQFCGACVDACPTGALFDKKGKWEGVPASIVPSVCAYCSVGCAVNVQTRADHVIRAVGRDGTANDGEVCVRGRFGVVDVVHNGTRLKAPMAKRGLKLAPVTWEAALDAAAQGLGNYRGDTFAAIGSATATNEDLFMLQRFAREIMQSDNVALAMPIPDDGLLGVLSEGSAPISDLRKAQAILVVGANPCESHPIIGLEIRRALNRGAQVIVVDLRRTGLAEQATLWLQPRLGTDARLLSAIAKALEADAGRAISSAARQTGVAADMIRQAAQILSAGPAMIVFGSGASQQPPAPATIPVLRSLATTLGAGMMALPGPGNAAGAYDMGMHPGLLPGYNPAQRAGRDYSAILEGIHSGAVKAVYLAGDEPALPEFAKIPFLVVQSIMHNEIVKSAQVALPAATFVEMDGTMTNLEGRVQQLRQAVRPVGQALPGWMIVRDLARRMGADWPVESASDVLRQIAAAIPAYASVNSEALGATGVVRRFAAATTAPGRRRKFASATMQFPLALIAERNQLYYMGVSLASTVKGMSEVVEENVLYVSVPDAARLGVTDGRQVRVASQHGSAYWLARPSDVLPEGVAYVSVNPVVGSPVFRDGMPGGKTFVRVDVSE